MLSNIEKNYLHNEFMFVNVYLWYNSSKCQDHVCCDLNVSAVLPPPHPHPTKHCLESKCIYNICLMPLYYTLLCVQSWKVEVKWKCTCYQQLHSNENTATFTPPPPTSPCVWAGGLHNKHVSVSLSLSFAPPVFLIYYFIVCTGGSFISGQSVHF